VLASGIIAKPVQRTAAARPAAKHRVSISERLLRNKSPRQLLLLAGVCMALLWMLGKLLSR